MFRLHTRRPTALLPMAAAILLAASSRLPDIRVHSGGQAGLFVAGNLAKKPPRR